MNRKREDSAQISKEGTPAITARIVLGDALTITGIIALSALAMYLGISNGKRLPFFLVGYLAWCLVVITKSWLHKEPFTLRDRFLFLLASALSALIFLTQAVMNSWNGKPAVLSWVLSTSWLVIAAYQFFVFSSKNLREMQ
jgi:urea transporter